MIFITLGTQKFQLDRLLIEMDTLVQDKKIGDNVYAQTGYCNYKPVSFPSCKFLSKKAFEKLMNQADLIITHGGSGSILSGLKNKKKIIAVPRLAQYGEHVDNHQLDLVQKFDEEGLICMCLNCSDLLTMINKAKKMEFNPFISNTQEFVMKLEKLL